MGGFHLTNFFVFFILSQRFDSLHFSLHHASVAFQNVVESDFGSEPNITLLPGFASVFLKKFCIDFLELFMRLCISSEILYRLLGAFHASLYPKENPVSISWAFSHVFLILEKSCLDFREIFTRFCISREIPYRLHGAFHASLYS